MRRIAHMAEVDTLHKMRCLWERRATHWQHIRRVNESPWAVWRYAMSPIISRFLHPHPHRLPNPRTHQWPRRYRHPWQWNTPKQPGRRKGEWVPTCVPLPSTLNGLLTLGQAGQPANSTPTIWGLRRHNCQRHHRCVQHCRCRCQPPPTGTGTSSLWWTPGDPIDELRRLRASIPLPGMSLVTSQQPTECKG